MIDWIQDSLHERNIRAKGPMRRNPIFARLDRMDGFLGYIWRLISQVLEEGESWVVLSLVGQLINFILIGTDSKVSESDSVQL